MSECEDCGRDLSYCPTCGYGGKDGEPLVLRRYNFSIISFHGVTQSGERLVESIEEVQNEVEYLGSKKGFIVASIESMIIRSGLAMMIGEDGLEVHPQAGEWEVWIGQPESLSNPRGKVVWHKKLGS